MKSRINLIFDLVFMFIIMAVLFYLAFGVGQWKTAESRPSGFAFYGYNNSSWDKISAATASAYNHEIDRLHPQRIEVEIIRRD